MARQKKQRLTSMLEDLIREDLREVRELDGKERQDKICEIEKLYKIDNERKKNSDDVIEKYVQIFFVPATGFAMLLGYRILMETETPPDIFFRDCGKTIMNLVAFKKC